MMPRLYTDLSEEEQDALLAKVKVLRAEMQAALKNLEVAECFDHYPVARRDALDELIKVVERAAVALVL